MLRLVVLCLLSCLVEGLLRKPAGSEVAEKWLRRTPVFNKVAAEMKLVAAVLGNGTTGKNKTEGGAALPLPAAKKATSTVANTKKEFEAVKNEIDAALKSGKKNDTEIPWWANASAGNMPNLTQTKSEKAPNEAKDVNVTDKDEKFPWWANASAGSMPNFTQTKSEKAPNEVKDTNVTKKKEKFPWWANASTGSMPNLTQTKSEKAPNEAKDVNVTKKKEKFPWWANASAGSMPNLTQTKSEKAPNGAKDVNVTKKKGKFPWWANASAGSMPNFTQIIKDLPKNLPKGQPTFAELGPFESKEAACEYCFSASYTFSSVVPNYICTAYDAASGPTMFCTATAADVKWVAEKDGGCKCVEKDPTAMGQTTCGPF